MNEKEYIDRSATVDALNKLCDRVCQYSKAQRKVMCGACPLGDAFTVIEDDLPVADVVEVDSVIPFVRVCDRKEYIKNSEKLINEYLAELLERFGVRCLAQSDNINGTVKFWAEKMDGGADDDDN